jgi:hypothetical protein
MNDVSELSTNIISNNIVGCKKNNQNSNFVGGYGDNSPTADKEFENSALNLEMGGYVQNNDNHSIDTNVVNNSIIENPTNQNDNLTYDYSDNQIPYLKEWVDVQVERESNSMDKNNSRGYIDELPGFIYNTTGINDNNFIDNKNSEINIQNLKKFNTKIENLQNNNEFQNYEHFSDIAIGFDSHNQIQKFLQQYNKVYSRDIFTNTQLIKKYFYKRFINDDKLSTIGDENLESIIQNKLIWLSGLTKEKNT